MINKILDSCIWINIHLFPHNERIIEVFCLFSPLSNQFYRSELLRDTVPDGELMANSGGLSNPKSRMVTRKSGNTD